MKTRILRVAVPVGTLVAAVQGYRWHRQRQLVLMPKGINDAAGVTMRSAIKSANPTAYVR